MLRQGTVELLRSVRHRDADHTDEVFVAGFRERLLARILATDRAGAAEVAAPPGTPPAPSRVRRTARRTVRAGMAGMAAIAAAGAALTVLAVRGTPGPGPSSAATALRHAGLAADTVPAAAVPKPGQYAFFETVSVGTGWIPTKTGSRGPQFTQTITTETWVASDGSGRVVTTRRLGFPSATARRRYISDGSPLGSPSGPQRSVATIPSGSTSRPIEGSPALLRRLDALPTDPARLGSLIASGRVSATGQVSPSAKPLGAGARWNVVLNLLTNTSPPALRSALYRVAAAIPGVQLLGLGADGIGRRATVVGLTAHGMTVEILFDPRTSALLEQRVVVQTPSEAGVPLAAGAVFRSETYVASGATTGSLTTPATAGLGRA